MQNNIGSTIFYSLLFAMGGAPTIAMLLIKTQQVDEAVFYQVFIGLSVIIACILVPIVLIQNTYLLFKRKNVELEQKIKPLSQFYLVLNALCLAFWLIIQFML